MSPYEGMMQPQQTMFQGNDDRFPRTRSIGDMEGVESEMADMDAKKIELDFLKDKASYESKKISQQKIQIQKLMEALKGGQ